MLANIIYWLSKMVVRLYPSVAKKGELDGAAEGVLGKAKLIVNCYHQIGPASLRLAKSTPIRN